MFHYLILKRLHGLWYPSCFFLFARLLGSAFAFQEVIVRKMIKYKEGHL